MTELITAWAMSCVAYGAALLYFLRNRALAAFSAVFFLALLLHVRPVIFFLGLDTPLVAQRFDDFPAYSALASLYGIGWLAVFTLVFAAAKGRVGAIGSALLPEGPVKPGVLVMRLAGLVVTLIAVVGTALLIKQQGSIAHFIYSVKIEKELTGSYWVRHISILAAVICLYGMLSTARPAATAAARRALRTIPTGSLFFYGFLILLNLAVNYLWGNRMNLALFAFASGLSVHLFIRPFRARELVVIAVLAASVLAGLGIVRRGLVSEVSNRTSTASVDARSVSLSLHFAEFDALMLALRDAGHQFEFRYGRDFYNGLVSWVPRSLLPERETYQIGGWFRRVYEPNRVNGWPVTVIGDWYINFGVLGVIFGAMLSGLAAALVDSAYCRARHHPWHAAIAPTLGFFFFYGGLNTGAPQQIIATIVPLALLSIAARMVSVSRSSAYRPLSA